MDCLSFLGLNLLFFYFALEGSYLVLTNNVIFRVFFAARPRGRTAESSAVLEGAPGNHFTAGFGDLVGRLFGAMT